MLIKGEIKMKRIFRAVAAVLCFVTIFAFAGCGRENKDLTVDKTKLQLYVKYYNGGFGDAWLKQLVSEFEEMYADVRFSNGKTGVQIMPEFTRGQLSGPSAMKGNRNNVYLMENIDYYSFVTADTLLDVTDLVNDYAVTGIAKDGSFTRESDKKISGKIMKAYDEFLNVNGKYYGLPLFETSINLNYDIDLFRQKCLYFAAGKTAENFTEEDFNDEEKISNLFISEYGEDMAFGPDGEQKTPDDGLPATYKDFRALTIYMKIVGVTPFVWNGYETGYLTGLINDMWANNEGEEQMKLNFTFDGTAKTLVDTIDEKGNVTLKPETTIDETNFKLLQRQKGKLDALEFAKLLLDDGTKKKDSRNYFAKSFDSGFSHTNAQSYFLNPEANNIGDNPIGFLVDGGWWYNEAKVQNRNIGILPLPKADASKIGTTNTKVSDRLSFMFISKETKAEVVPVAKAFLSFLQTDHAMRTYTAYTNTFRAMKYDLTTEILDKMDSYGKSVYATRNSAGTVVLPWTPISSTARKNAGLLSYRTYGFSVNSQENNPLIYFKDHKASTKEYFEKIWDFRK